MRIPVFWFKLYKCPNPECDASYAVRDPGVRCSKCKIPFQPRS